MLAITGGRGVDLVYDGVGGKLGAQGMAAVRPGGRAAIYGMASGTWTEPASGVHVVPDGGAPSAAETRALAAEALSLAAAGRLRPIIGGTYALAEAARAHRAIEASVWRACRSPSRSTGRCRRPPCRTPPAPATSSSGSAQPPEPH